MKHTTRVGGGSLIYDSADWRAGLAPQGHFSATSDLKRTTDTGFSYLANIDPFNTYGILGPGVYAGAAPTNSTNLAGSIVGYELLNNTVALLVDQGGKIQYYNMSTHSLSTAGSFSASGHTITGTTPIGQDGILYRHNSGGATTQKTSFFYSYYNTVNWDIGAYIDAPNVGTGGTFDDDFMSTVPTTPLDVSSGDGDDATQRTAPHVLEIGRDDVLYVGSGRYLHAYDGATGSNGTFTSRALTLPAGFQIASLKKQNDLFIIFGNYYSTGNTNDGSGVALAYVWNYTDADPSIVIPLEDSYVSTSFLWKGTPCVITYGINGSNGKTKVKAISGNSVITIADFDGTPPAENGVIVVDGVTYMNSGGKILSVGNPFVRDSAVGSRAVNHLMSVRAPNTSGVIFYSDVVGAFVASSDSGGNYALNRFVQGNGLGSGSAYTPYDAPIFPVGTRGRVTAVHINFYQKLASGGTNGNLTCTLNFDSGDATSVLFTNSSTVTKLVKKYTRDSASANFPQFSMLGIQLVWAGELGGTAPRISSMVIEYENVNQDF